MILSTYGWLVMAAWLMKNDWTITAITLMIIPIAWMMLPFSESVAKTITNYKE